MSTPKKKPFQDYYLLFGLQQTASQSEIKTAYRELALKLHPDQNPSPEAHQQFLLLNEAYRILNNPDERSKYDLKYKNYYNPAKNTAGITERIEINRAKRASRYGRSMYSQRMRYRSSGSGGFTAHSQQNRTSYSSGNSTYNWDKPVIDPEEELYRKYALYAQILVVIILLFSTYNLADYFFRVLSEKVKVVESITSESGDVKVFARKYYYQSFMFYVQPKDSIHFSYDTEVQLERSYFKGRLYQIRVYKEDRILLIQPTEPFYDYPFYLLILVIISGLSCLLFTKSSKRSLKLAAITFVLSSIWSLTL